MASSHPQSVLDSIKSSIEKMDKKRHIEVLKILKKYATVRLSENKSGVFVNLSYLTKDPVDDLLKYISYIDEQESALLSIETQKHEYQHTFFSQAESVRSHLA